MDQESGGYGGDNKIGEEIMDNNFENCNQAVDHPIINLKTESEGLEVEYEVVPIYNTDYENDFRKKEINDKINDLDEKMAENQVIINQLNDDIDRLTSSADGWDCLLAACSGVITGLIDAFFVGEFDLNSTKNNIDQKFNDIITKKAREIEENEKNQEIEEAIQKARKKAEEKGTTLNTDKINEITNSINQNFEKKYDINKKIERAIEKAKEKGEIIDNNKIEEITNTVKNNELARSIRKLEEKFGIPSDSVYQESGDGISSKSHHLDDLAHHPTIIGWLASILTQFTGNAYFQNKYGTNIKIKAMAVKTGKDGIEIRLIGEGIKEKLFCGTINWLWHLVSDMAGSNSSAKKGNYGMGLPGPILSMLKELAMFFPFVNKTALPQILNDLFTKDEFRFDLRSELALGIEVGKQAIPVMINEAIVRAFYFIRRLIVEIKEKRDIHKIEWKNTIPFNNRTIVRMMTIATTTFTVTDLADAAIRGVINSGGTVAGFCSQLLLRINFVGVGRCVIAYGADIAMGINRSNLRDERIAICCEQIYLLNAKIFYKQTNMWIAAENAEKSIEETKQLMKEAILIFNNAFKDMNDDINKIDSYIPSIEEKNPGLLDDLQDILNWG